MRAAERLIKTYLTLREQKRKINVAALCKAADVDRSTFYKNFRNLKELEACAIDKAVELFAGLLDEYNYDTEPTSMVEDLVSALKRDPTPFLMLFGRFPSEAAFDELYSFIKDKTMKVWIRESSQSPDFADMLLTYILSGSFAVLRKWLNSGFALEEEKVCSLILGVVRYGVYEFIYTE